MVLLGNLLKRTISIRSKLAFTLYKPANQQEITLRNLIRKARNTEFGKKFRFNEMLTSPNLCNQFREEVPIYDYDSIHEKWWHRNLNGEENICWPNKINTFALSSGTSGSPSKYIPISSEMIKSIRKASIKQLTVLAHYNLPGNLFNKGILMLGGSTDLKYNGNYYFGDLSGISVGKVPAWFQKFYKPGPEIAKEADWEKKISEIVKIAPEWDIWIICGSPAWLQILIERIIETYKVENIHDIWPNLKVFAHGGVSFTPYKKSFESNLGKPLLYFDTYLASEGFIAYDARPQSKGMKLILNNGVYFEFVPFNSENFDIDGNILPNAKALTISEIKEEVEYAILLSTCAGAWRYLIGDVIKFKSLDHLELQIVGRTKSYISLCGEHVSVDNMNSAIEEACEKLDIKIKEFTLMGEPYGSLFAHHWYIGCDDKVDKAELRNIIDKTLCKVNDDYATERIAVLKEVIVDVVPNEVFINWMAKHKKLGGQHKFPRVLKGEMAIEWKNFVKENR